jgi:hypothetical protein
MNGKDVVLEKWRGSRRLDSTVLLAEGSDTFVFCTFMYREFCNMELDLNKGRQKFNICFYLKLFFIYFIIILIC